ncbi:murein transglycosylase domain-containing protein [Cognaticolwellia mytili]|uniref:murein transglycosylase domain-containing protein n=1 Tax=Cognaticolwellia mytili TaxID=1888913 RepID=UPI000A1748ED|nr:murein transglycosylase domain-containing protein [Cognaticolwellia mytili]
MLKKVMLLLVVISLTSCKSTPNLASIRSAETLIKQINANNPDLISIAQQTVKTKQLAQQDVNNIKDLLKELSKHINDVWGEAKPKVSNNKKLVKYTNEYKARAIVDFEKGSILVETLADSSPAKTIHNLQQAIVTTLLSTSDPQKTDIFSSDAPQLSGKPYLYLQVLDRDNQPIQYQWRANRFSKYLTEFNLQKYSKNQKKIYAVRIKMVEKHQHLREEKYSRYVLAAAKRYRLSPQLIYGIIETESSFNPFAVSSANAYGLMQVVPKTAGADVYQRIKKKKGMPTKQQLFDPAFNIDIGSAYLHILNNNYLKAVKNNTSRHYSIISAYNGGAGNVLKTFHSNRQTAMNVINDKAPKDVYYLLTNKHPKAESRRYLEKVTKAEKEYL